MHSGLFFKMFRLNSEEYQFLDSILALENYRISDVYESTIELIDNEKNTICIRKSGMILYICNVVGDVISDYMVDLEDKSVLANYKCIKDHVIYEAMQGDFALTIFEPQNEDEYDRDSYEIKDQISNDNFINGEDPGYYLSLGKIYFLSHLGFNRTLEK